VTPTGTPWVGREAIVVEPPRREGEACVAWCEQDGVTAVSKGAAIGLSDEAEVGVLKGLHVCECLKVRDTGGIEPPMVADRVASTRLAYDGHIHPVCLKQVLPVPQLGASSLCYRMPPPMGRNGCVSHRQGVSPHLHEVGDVPQGKGVHFAILLEGDEVVVGCHELRVRDVANHLLGLFDESRVVGELRSLHVCECSNV